MASLIITSIQSALDDLALISMNTKVPTGFIQYSLKLIRTFLLCTRKLPDDTNLNMDSDRNLGSLLGRIGDSITKNVSGIQPYCRASGAGSYAEAPKGVSRALVDRACCRLDYAAMSFYKEINQWYCTLAGSLHLLQSCSLTIGEVMEIMESVLENIADLQSQDLSESVSSIDQIEAMEEQMKLLRNFVRFVALQSVQHQQLENVVMQVASIAIDAANMTVWIYCCPLTPEEKKSKVVAVLQKIKSIDPRVLEAYRTALVSSKSSMELQSSQTLLHLDLDPLIIMKDFIDFLLWRLWETQLTDSIMMISKDQLQPLWEGLKRLRTILQEQPNKFDDKIKHLSRVLICDAGVIIFSLFQKDAKIDFGLADWLEKFETIREKAEDQVPETTPFNLSKTNALGFLNSLLDNLMEVKGSKVDSNVQTRVQTIREDLAYLKSVLELIVVWQNQQEDLQGLWDLAVQISSKMKFLIDRLVLGDIPDSYSTSFDSIMQDMRIFKTDAQIFRARRKEIEVKKDTQTSIQAPPQISPPAIDQVVGFEDETTLLIDRLTRGSKKLQVIAIVGMPGLGKTTLATKIYNDPKIMCHFHVRGRCSISQTFNRRKLLLELLNQVVMMLPDSYLKMSEDDLVQVLWRSLKQRRFLILLDDLWDIEAWNSLRESLPDDSNESRILLTSRHSDVVPQAILDSEPHFLRHLTNDESWELLQRKLFPKDNCPLVLFEVGRQIADNCNGLPLTVVIVAGLLATLKQDVWKEVLESLSTGIISSTEQCIYTLELSYKHLPDHLKPCFLYFGLFPEDEEISFNQLILLWIAEGFVHKTELKSSEDVAADYLMDLVRRSLVIVSKKGSTSAVKAVRIHDLLHDFCMTRAKEENFFLLLKGYDEILASNEARHLQRLCIHSKKRDFKNLRLFHPNIYSLLFFAHQKPWETYKVVRDISFIILVFQRLRVLEIRQFDLDQVPKEVELLVQLNYLAVKGEINGISSFIGNLSNLETLIVDSSRAVVLPDTIWDLHKLRHLCIANGFHFSIENLDNSSDLHELQSCSTAIISWDSCEKLMRKFPNIRKLKCRVFERWDTRNCDKFLTLDCLGQLTSLCVTPYYQDGQSFGLVPKGVRFEFSFPPNLTKLALDHFVLSEKEISTIGKLSNLQVLKLHHVEFCEGVFDMIEGEFSKLIFLKLSYSNIARWTADSGDQLPNLQKLVLECCKDLEEVPSFLEDISGLEMIEILNCSDSVQSMFQHFQDEQKELGNLALKILISHRRMYP